MTSTKTETNIEIERKYFSSYDLEEADVPETLIYKTSISHDRYYISPLGLIRLRDDEEKGIEITAKTYKKDNLHRREINLGLVNHINIRDCLEFAEVAGWTLRLEFVQRLKIWITGSCVISQTNLEDVNGKPYHFSREIDFITEHQAFPLARFIEIEVLDVETRQEAIKEIGRYQNLLGLRKKDIIKHSLIQLFGAYPR